MIDLTNRDSVQSSLFVEILLATPLRFSDHPEDFDIDGETYTALGNFLGVSNTRSQLRTAETDVTITLSGIPNSAIQDVLNTPLKGQPVRILRGFFDISTGNIIDEPQGRFLGFIDNFSISESLDVSNRSASNTVELICSSSVQVLSRKVSGRRTNPQSMKSLFASDTSFDRIPALEETTFAFGKTQ